MKEIILVSAIFGLIACLGCKEEKTKNFLGGDFRLGPAFEFEVPPLYEVAMVDASSWLDEVGDIACERAGSEYGCVLWIGEPGAAQLKIWGYGDSITSAEKDCALEARKVLSTMDQVITYARDCSCSAQDQERDVTIGLDITVEDERE